MQVTVRFDRVKTLEKSRDIGTVKILMMKGEKGDPGENGYFEDLTEEQIAELKENLRAFYQKHEGIYTTEAGNTATIGIPISGYRDTDMLFVDVNGLDLADGVDYTLNDGYITLANPITHAGAIVHFVAMRVVAVETGDYSSLRGDDGVSPTIATSKTGKVTTIEITDANGTHTATVNDGADGLGVPAGGTAGQLLVKQSATDNDTAWETISASDIGAADANHTHPDATQSASGFMSATDKTKLDGIQDATQSASGLMSAADKTKLDGMGVILFDNDNQAMSGGITLSETAANFSRLVICYKTNDGIYASAEVYNPNGKLVELSATGVSAATPPNLYYKVKHVLINGTSINTRNNNGHYATAQVRLGGTYTATEGDNIAITQVIGYR